MRVPACRRREERAEGHVSCDAAAVSGWLQARGSAGICCSWRPDEQVSRHVLPRSIGALQACIVLSLLCTCAQSAFHAPSAPGGEAASAHHSAMSLAFDEYGRPFIIIRVGDMQRLQGTN